MKFELWLDESGDFKNDYKTHLNPSLVGGILTLNTITDKEALQILGKEFMHFNEVRNAEFTINVLEKLKMKETEFVIFQNKERLMVIDGDTTYLNILAEGIIQLFLYLSANYGDFQIDITVATRKNIAEGFGIIEKKEYEQRLREKIILGLARKALTRKNNWNYRILFDDARTSQKLMLADGVCNTYLTRTSSKFNLIQLERIEKLYKTPYIFSFYENIVEVDLKRGLAEGKLGEVIFEIFMNESFEKKNEYLEISLKRLNDLDQQGQKLQLHSISSRIEALIKIDQSYQLTKPILIRIQEDLIKRLTEQGIRIPEFNLDIILYLYTLYTHEGSVEAILQDEMFLKEYKYIDDIMTKFSYFNIYKLRKALYQKNMLNVNSSIQDISKVIQILEEMVEVHQILVEDLGEDKISPHMFDVLGKAYGSRGQGYTMLIHQDITYLNQAINDFDQALLHFSFEKDKERQYLYKALAFCEGKQFEKAIYYLYKSCSMNQSEFESLLRRLKEQELSKTIFKFNCYFKILAYLKEDGNSLIADKMYNALLNEGINPLSFLNGWKEIHPNHLILWNMGKYLILKGKQQTGMKYLDEAITICNGSTNQVTIKTMQLGICADKLLSLQNTNKKQEVLKAEKVFLNHYTSMVSDSKYKDIIEVLNPLFLANMGKEQLKKLVEITRSIN